MLATAYSRQLVTRWHSGCIVIWVIAAIWGFFSSQAIGDEQLKRLGNSVKDVQEASAVLFTLSERSDLTVTDVLRAMKGQSEVSKNWYLSLAQSLADRSPAKAQQDCMSILEQLSEDPTARYWAFSFLTAQQPSLRSKLLESMQSDPCPELRYEAIEHRLNILEQSPPTTTEERRTVYGDLLKLARLPSQVTKIAEFLKQADSPVNLLEHFGFISHWYTIGPFDNTNLTGFNVVYEPEEQYLQGHFSADTAFLELPSISGKSDKVRWIECSTNKDDGAIDLATAYQKEKGAVVYAFSTFDSPQELDAQVRIGSQTAVKVWVNGKELISREAYHEGAQIDQYSADVRLRAGPNTVFIKTCQNKQIEPWAQEWFFQLRFCDSTGLAIQQVK